MKDDFPSRELYSTAGLTDAGGFVVEQYDYDAYGQVKGYDGLGQPLPDGRVSVTGNPYFFTGQRLDSVLSPGPSVLNLYHYRGRWYDATHGRFGQRDVQLYADGYNLYEYVKSDPMMYADAMGEAACSTCCGPPPRYNLPITQEIKIPLTLSRCQGDMVDSKSIFRLPRQAASAENGFTARGKLFRRR